MNDDKIIPSGTSMSITEFSLPQRFKTNRTAPLRWILSHAKQNWYILLSATIGAFLNAALMSVSPILIGRAYNLITAPNAKENINALGTLALILGITQVIRGGMQLMRNLSFELIAQRTERNVRDELYITLLGKSMTFHSLQPVGDTMARATNDVRQVNFFFSPGLNMVIGSLNFLIMPVILAPTYHPSLIITPIVFIIMYFLALWEYMGKLRPITNRVRETFGKLNTRLAEALDGIETVKGASQEKSEVALFIKNATGYKNAVVDQGKTEARFLPLLLLSTALAAGLLQALLLYKNGVIDMGQVIGYYGLLLMLDFPTFTSLWAYSQIATGLAGARRLLELMNRENNLDQNLAGFNEPMKGEVEFKGVSFGYEDGDPILENISFKVKPGKTVAIVGQTGSSKTSLVKLINRTYDTIKGEVLVDGVNVRDWNLETLRRNISIIEQDVFLFSRSIGENIAFGKPGATRDEIEAAAKAAQADEFILTFKDGYDTILGERGVTLSGGQRQRLALARAFLTDPRILVLDDSTSAIDSATEDRIQRAIYTAAKGRTTFIITHRLSQIRWADLILVMRKGRLVAMGSHEELMKISEAYQRIFS
jgi:ATP-binding cassette subfamily B protein